MAVSDGPDGEVYIPVTYYSDPESTDEALRLGRETSWSEDGDGPVRGYGQRMFLVGEDAHNIMDLQTIEFGI
jgi:type VI secretion system protein ImpE